jgi:hypothetical protein
MSGIGVAKGIEVKKPENCEKCQRRQCDLECQDFNAHKIWEKNKKFSEK